MQYNKVNIKQLTKPFDFVQSLITTYRLGPDVSLCNVGLDLVGIYLSVLTCLTLLKSHFGDSMNQTKVQWGGPAAAPLSEHNTYIQQTDTSYILHCDWAATDQADGQQRLMCEPNINFDLWPLTNTPNSETELWPQQCHAADWTVTSDPVTSDPSSVMHSVIHSPLLCRNVRPCNTW